MTTVFLSGSRSIRQLHEAVRARLDNAIAQGMRFVVGDADGADKAMQAYLAERHHEAVRVFHVGDAPRNNVGSWPTRRIETPAGLKGRQFYEMKDRAMADEAEFALALWDGKSLGSIKNVADMTRRHKQSLIFHHYAGDFVTISTPDQFRALLDRCEPASRAKIGHSLADDPALGAAAQLQPSML